MITPNKRLDCDSCDMASRSLGNEPVTGRSMPCRAVLSVLLEHTKALPIEAGTDVSTKEEIAARLAFLPDGPLKQVGEGACQVQVNIVNSQLLDPMGAHL